MPHLDLSFLGPLQVKLDGHTVTAFEADKVRALLVYLAVESSRPHRREQLASLFWPGWPDASARTSLRNALSNLRKAIGDETAEPPFLFITRETIQFNPDSDYSLDITEIERLTRNSHTTADQLVSAVGFYRGAFLEGFTLKDCPAFDDWSLVVKEQLQAQASGVLARLGEMYEKGKEYEKAIACARQRLTLEPWQEDAHRQLMRLLSLSGRRPAALAQFEACKRALKSELGVEPSVETMKLYESIRDSQQAEPKRERAHPHNLHAQLTSFIGREKEITEVLALLVKNRLVTLTGSGGVGKTRLALQVAASVLDRFPDGAWLIELAPLANPEMVALSVAYGLGMRDTSSQDTLDILGGYLRNKHLLLVLDNCEHLIEACARLAERLLQTCPRLVILATSREALGIGGEIAFHMPSLAFPNSQHLPALEELAQMESVRLFCERAAAVQPAFALTGTSAPALAQICQRLGGIPLAIELAAARMRMMTVEQVAERLDNAFRLLTGGSRTALSRHQTIKATIDWSYSLLSKAEKLLLGRLSVFAGGWTLEAAEQVCSDPKETGRPEAINAESRLEPGDVLDLLGRLVDKSLVTLEISVTGAGRYHMLETARQYAHNRLEEDEKASGGGSQILHDRHLEYFFQLALQAEQHLRGLGQVEWLDRLEEELDNLRLAVHWGLTGRVVDDLRLVNSLFYFFHLHGHSTEGIEWYKQLLSAETMLPALADPAARDSRRLARARGLLRVAYLVYLHRNRYTTEQVRKELEESVAILRELGPDVSHDLALALVFLSPVLLEPAQAAASFREGMELAQKIGDRFIIAECLWWSVHHHVERGGLEQIKVMVEERLALLRELSDQDGIGSSLYFLARIALLQGEYGKAADLLDESLVNVQSVRNQWSLGLLFENRTKLARAQGDYPRAIQWAEEGLAIFQALDEKTYILVFLYELGMAAWASGDYLMAAHQGNEALALAKEIGYGASTYLAHHLLGRTALSQGDLVLAQQHLQRLIKERSNAKISLWIPPASNEAYLIDTAYLLETLAVLSSALKAMPQAVRWFGAIADWETRFAGIYCPRERSEHQAALEKARQALGEEAFSAAWTEGQALSLEQAVALILENHE